MDTSGIDPEPGGRGTRGAVRALSVPGDLRARGAAGSPAAAIGSDALLTTARRRAHSKLRGFAAVAAAEPPLSVSANLSTSNDVSPAPGSASPCSRSASAFTSRSR